MEKRASVRKARSGCRCRNGMIGDDRKGGRGMKACRPVVRRRYAQYKDMFEGTGRFRDGGMAMGSELPDNPEVSNRLTNLSMRHAGTRPAWFDSKPLPLRGRTRQCRRIFWRMVEDQAAMRRRLILLTAEHGMGKTSFLAELNSMLERAPGSVLTLAPGIPSDRPFHSLRSIMEQRFYISNKAPISSIRRFVESAVSSIMPSDDVDGVIGGLLTLWEKHDKAEGGSTEEVLQSQDTVVTGRAIADGDGQEHVDVHDADDVAAMVERLEEPLIRFFRADLRHNALVIILDDMERHDQESLMLLSWIYRAVSDLPLIIFATTSSTQTVPGFIRECAPEFVRLQALSDIDLEMLTDHFLCHLYNTPGGHMVPRDVCRLIAQRAFGSPQRAIDLVLRYLAPGKVSHWNEVMERLREQLPPVALGDNIVSRFRGCSELDRLVLMFVSQLDAPFSAHTLECILGTWHEFRGGALPDCRRALRRLADEEFLVKANVPCSPPLYVFKHESERVVVAEAASSTVRHHVYGHAAQWYALNNDERKYDETIADLWNKFGANLEACHYYVRCAYQAYRCAELPRAWRIFGKLIKCIPEDSLARRVQYSLDAADVAFRLGKPDDAFMLCRQASHYAGRLASFAQGARASLRIADILIETGRLRHVGRYLARAQDQLSQENHPQIEFELQREMAKYFISMHDLERAQAWVDRAWKQRKTFNLSPHDSILLSLVEARLLLERDMPLEAMGLLRRIIIDAKAAEERTVLGQAHHLLGIVYSRSDDLSMALETWNNALGMAQETNDVVLHAGLLADIADGAFELEARRTARAASEQCLVHAQHTHQKYLIARCLVHTAMLHYYDGEYDKSMRCLRKAHRSAVSAHDISICANVLAHIAMCYGREGCSQDGLVRADRLYRKLFDMLEHKDIRLIRAGIVPQYCRFLIRTHQNMCAMNAYWKAQAVYRDLGLEKACDKIQSAIDELSREIELAGPAE